MIGLRRRALRRVGHRPVRADVQHVIDQPEAVVLTILVMRFSISPASWNSDDLAGIHADDMVVFVALRSPED